MDPLRLQVTDFQDETRWRWVLRDGQGRFLADHQVRLEPSAREYQGLLDLGRYLDFYSPVYPPAEQLKDLGVWIGDQVFGGLKQALADEALPPATPVRVEIPAAARALLQRPFDLACLAGRDGPTLGDLGLSLVYCPEGLPDGSRAKTPAAEGLRILACFSLPDGASALNLRRERYQLKRLVRDLVQTRSRAVELRVIQYGATRETLKDALQEAPGWDLIHLSGHGGKGEILLETPDGRTDRIGATALAGLLKPARGRLKLLILDACHSGAAGHLAARAQLGMGLDQIRDQTGDQTRDPGDPSQGPAGSAAQTALPSLAEDLARTLDCAALAMRYPVGDEFATDLSLALYEKLLDRGQPLPAALRLALDQALASDPAGPPAVPSQSEQAPQLLPLSPFTPMLLGPRAAGLTLVPPARPASGFALPQTGLLGFPEEPARFVGRLGPMLRASLALAPESPRRGVLFYGMAGAGKTACALELAYRHEHGRFAGQVWYRGPEEGREVATALGDLMLEIERQLNASNLNLALYVDQPEPFCRLVLPRLKALLEQHALLLVLDNLEHLLADSGDWRDPLWGDLLGALLGHRGLSRVVLTSRRLPNDLAPEGAGPGPVLANRVLREPIHALSLAESVLLARELPNLRRLFADAQGRKLLERTLLVVQGHPKLLELADGLAADPKALAAQVAATEPRAADQEAVLNAFFAVTGKGGEGESAQPEPAFVHTLHRWTQGVSDRLEPIARLLLQFLCRLEPEDRSIDAVQSNWRGLLTRLGDQTPAADALALPDQGLAAGLAALETVGLVDAERPVPDPSQLSQPQPQGTRFHIHPGVAESVLAKAPPEVLAAADTELGDYHIGVFQHGRKTETEGGGGLVVSAGRRGAPYLMRCRRWVEATTLLEHMATRDQSPETLGLAIPLLRRIVEATAGTERELIDAGVLARTIWQAGRATEAELEMRRIVKDAVSARQFRVASAVAGDLLNLLIAAGRLPEALGLAEDIAGYTREAGLGPWTQLADETYRLQVLAAMGRYEEVLEQMDALRVRMDALPEQGQADEALAPWNVREALLDTGRTAAVQTGRWDQALGLNAEVLKWTSGRGATDLELARTRFNDYGPLVRLGRLDDCRRLLQGCRAVFEREHDVANVGNVYSALADLQDKAGDRGGAIGFEQAALRFRYQAVAPEGCSISHHNLSTYLKRHGADSAQVLAHRLASAALGIQTGSGGLQETIRNLANLELPDRPPPFATIADQVEQVEGVRFRALFAALPAAYPDGDAALAAVWGLVRQEVQGRTAGDGGSAAPTQEDRLRQLDPLLQAIAAVAGGDQGPRAQVEQLLAQLEQKGWMLRGPVQRLWSGERSADSLTAGLDPQDSALIRRLLELLPAPE